MLLELTLLVAFTFAGELTKTFAFVARLLFASALTEVFAGAVFEELELSGVVCKTEIFPVMAGNANNKAESIKVVAAVIVILDKTD